ncbi:uncharacterized protein LOC132554572 [Ylistrum balloti]|uniref:uncharacterized protein LOC132554572 n=1 Tax=Ylistrum balloti TaxID=509963 RepID=UPI002905F323|nr:uncharacterized protein LOC132554572 [Ylistrum balloti]
MYWLVLCPLLTHGLAEAHDLAGDKSRADTHDLARDPNQCLFISSTQTIESSEKIRSLKDSKMCFKRSCDLNDEEISCDSLGGHVCVNLACLCEKRIPLDGMECYLKNLTEYCCQHYSQSCFNRGQLNKSDCSSFRCTCPQVRGYYIYKGERCENISVIRVCMRVDTVNKSYRSCDDENDITTKCRIANDNLECGPALRNITGIDSLKKCKITYNTKTSPRLPSGVGNDVPSIWLLFLAWLFVYLVL